MDTDETDYRSVNLFATLAPDSDSETDSDNDHQHCPDNSTITDPTEETSQTYSQHTTQVISNLTDYVKTTCPTRINDLPALLQDTAYDESAALGVIKTWTPTEHT